MVLSRHDGEHIRYTTQISTVTTGLIGLSQAPASCHLHGVLTPTDRHAAKSISLQFVAPLHLVGNWANTDFASLLNATLPELADKGGMRQWVVLTTDQLAPLPALKGTPPLRHRCHVLTIHCTIIGRFIRPPSMWPVLISEKNCSGVVRPTRDSKASGSACGHRLARWRRFPT